MESGERGKRQSSGLSAEGRSDPNELTEREGKARSKRFERPLRLRRRTAEISQENRLHICKRFYVESGGDLLSRTVTSQVPSALKGLTSVFGMGTGGTPSSLPPEMVSYVCDFIASRLVYHSVTFVPLSERSACSVVLFFLLTCPWDVFTP